MSGKDVRCFSLWRVPEDGFVCRHGFIDRGIFFGRKYFPGDDEVHRGLLVPETTSEGETYLCSDVTGGLLVSRDDVTGQGIGPLTTSPEGGLRDDTVEHRHGLQR